MNGCIYRTEENKCKQFSVGGVLSFCYLDGTCDCCIPSNADRIRQMSDEELAYLLHDHSCSLCPLDYKCDGRVEVGRKKCKEYWLRWLNAAVEVDK